MNDPQLLPYLTFDGNCQEAMEFYKEIFGGELTVMRYGEMYGDEVGEADKNKVLHSMLENGALTLMASDVVPGAITTFGDNVRVTVTGTDKNSEKLATFFEKLSEGGVVLMPYEKQAWGQELGMLTDKFGTHWMASIHA
jgi:PhnB protein